MIARWLRRAAAEIRRLRREPGGAVMVEFAVWSSAIFVALMVALDFGGYYIARGAINEAISAAAVKSFGEREDVDFAALPAYVRNMAENQSLQVTLSCNGAVSSCTNFNRTCACLRSDATYAAAECGAPCSASGTTANSVAGYYLTITASQTYQPVLLPSGVLSDAAMTQATTVRLQ